MPSVEFFRKAGFFIVPDFLQRSFVADLRHEMENSPKEKALVVMPDGDSTLDEDTRRMLVPVVPEKLETVVVRQLLRLKPDLEQHFQVRLAGCEPPHYLIYRPGDFFTQHADMSYSGGNAHTRQRRVSVVLFLNSESEEPSEETYGNGRLTFYGLLEGPEWERCGFAVSPAPGLLIAFPSDKVHEVTPVSHGHRFTVATWFYAPDGEAASS